MYNSLCPVSLQIQCPVHFVAIHPVNISHAVFDPFFVNLFTWLQCCSFLFLLNPIVPFVGSCTPRTMKGPFCVCGWAAIVRFAGYCSLLVLCLPTICLIFSSHELPLHLTHSWACWFFLCFEICCCLQLNIYAMCTPSVILYFRWSMSMLISICQLVDHKLNGGSFRKFKSQTWCILLSTVYKYRCLPSFEFNVLHNIIDLSSRLWVLPINTFSAKCFRMQSI